MARNPSRIDAERGDHLLQADFRGLIPPSKPDSLRLADSARIAGTVVH
jgi:hypothetical protein